MADSRESPQWTPEQLAAIRAKNEPPFARRVLLSDASQYRIVTVFPGIPLGGTKV